VWSKYSENLRCSEAIGSFAFTHMLAEEALGFHTRKAAFAVLELGH
jgi:hypothetical protein